jgi:DUF1009 family protein
MRLQNEKMQSIGLLAGNGHFPLLFARAAKRHGIDLVAVGLRGETDPQLGSEVQAMHWVRIGQLGKTIRLFQQSGIKQVAMAGGVRKTRLFFGEAPDLLGLTVLARCVLRRDDSMLRAVANEFEKRGIQIIDSTLYMPEALAPEGVLTTRQPNNNEWRDLRYGLSMAHEIGKLDIGQTVIVKDGAVIALEAIEGTDACIARAGDLTAKSGAVVVKIAKPVQDMRFDLPTIDSLVSAGISVLGIEAGRTLLLEPERLLTTANAHRLTIVGLNHLRVA